MEETGNIIAAGCGGSSKIIDTKKNKISRVYNHKYPYEYIARFSEIVERKNSVAALVKTALFS